MRRLLLILLTIPLLAASAEGEWKVIKGEWKQPTKTSWQTKFGTLQYSGDSPSSPCQLAATICVRSWDKPESGLRIFAIMWGSGNNGNALFFGPAQIQARRLTGDKKINVPIPWSPHIGRPIAIAINFHPEYLDGNVGGRKFRCPLSSTNLDNLRFEVNGPDVIIASLSSSF